MLYHHQDIAGEAIDLPAGKIVCIGRNYLDHIRELENNIPEQALLFIKPSTALCSIEQPLFLPQNLGECHNEVELALLVKDKIDKHSHENFSASIWGVGLGLDLTLRDLQTKLKSSGQPWERAKAFDHSCPMTQFVPIDEFTSLDDIEFSLTVNEQLRQNGNSNKMMRSIDMLIDEIRQVFTLLPGDIILTGTPAGVGALQSGDKLALSLANRYKFGCEIK